MLVLGINTSSDLGSVGVIKEDLLLGELALKGNQLQNTIVMIDFLLSNNQLNIQDIDLFTVVLGPGSWSGLRVGVTTAKSLAHALNKPIVGVSSLDMLAYKFRFTEKLVYPCLDAKNHQVIFAEYNCQGEIPQRLGEYRLDSFDNFLSQIKLPSIVTGDAGLKYRKELISQWGNQIAISPFLANQIQGSFIASAGLSHYLKSGADDNFSLTPLYLQKTAAEINSHNPLK
jgi:tRNA threonylcarbamoyladenosine biosynthesis protein TsaB